MKYFRATYEINQRRKNVGHAAHLRILCGLKPRLVILESTDQALAHLSLGLILQEWGYVLLVNA